MSIWVLIADDDDVFRETLAGTLAAAGPIDVVATARNGAEAVELYRKLEPDVVLLDVVMPGCDGIEATRGIRALDGDACIIALTDGEDHRALGLCLGAGAAGALKKGPDTATLTPMMVALAMTRAGRRGAPAPVDALPPGGPGLSWRRHARGRCN